MPWGRFSELSPVRARERPACGRRASWHSALGWGHTCRGNAGKRWEGDQLCTGHQRRVWGAAIPATREVSGVGYEGKTATAQVPQAGHLSTQESNCVLCLFQKSANFRHKVQTMRRDKLKWKFYPLLVLCSAEILPITHQQTRDARILGTIKKPQMPHPLLSPLPRPRWHSSFRRRI